MRAPLPMRYELAALSEAKMIQLAACRLGLRGNFSKAVFLLTEECSLRMAKLGLPGSEQGSKW